jgi:hypothetical protein
VSTTPGLSAAGTLKAMMPPFSLILESGISEPSTRIVPVS